MESKTLSNYQERISEMRLEILKKVEDFFTENEITFIKFNHMFTLYITEDHTGEYHKVPFTVQSLEEGRVLFGQDCVGDDYEMGMEAVEDLSELAYILDVLEKGEYYVEDDE